MMAYGLTTSYSPALPVSPNTPSPASGNSSRHHRRRLRARLLRTTPSGSMTTERIAVSVTSTAVSGTASATSRHSRGSGARSAGKALTSQIST